MTCEVMSMILIESIYADDVYLVYHLPYVLVHHLQGKYELFASSFVSESKYEGMRYYISRTIFDLVEIAKVLKWNWGKLIWQQIYTKDAHSVTEEWIYPDFPYLSTLPNMSTPWIYWHAYYVPKAQLLASETVPITNQVESLWYSGLYKDDWYLV